jgi:1,4-dihydroxy-2-naphthoate polyprenyltransferase
VDRVVGFNFDKDGPVPGADALSARAWANRSRMAVWFQLTRVGSLTISGIAVFVGASIALMEGLWSPRIFLALIGAIALQVGTNLTNVSFNWKAVGVAPNHPSDLRGSSAPVQLGIVKPEEVRRVAFAAFGVGALVGLWLVSLVGWPILLFGIPGLLVGFFYSAPPVRLSYLAMGVVSVFLCIGPGMVLGSYYTVTGTLSTAAVLVSIPVGLLAAGIMHTNDLRDHEGDVRHGKRTLSTVLGREASSHLLLGMVAGAYVAVLVGVERGLLPWPVLATLLTLPLAVKQIRLVYREGEPLKLNEAWTMGVQLLTGFGVLLVLGLLAGAWLG